MTAQPIGPACDEQAGHCITCGDEGIEMRVIDPLGQLAVCADAAGERHEVAVDLVGPVQTGDAVLVHAGVAIRQLEVAA